MARKRITDRFNEIGKKAFLIVNNNLNNTPKLDAYGGIAGMPAREEAFTLDEVGNWPGYLTETSGTTDLNQSRAHNTANETGTIGTNTTGLPIWVTPTYDANGNMTAGPKPGDETTNLKFVYDAGNRMVKATDNAAPTHNTIASYNKCGLECRAAASLC